MTLQWQLIVSGEHIDPAAPLFYDCEFVQNGAYHNELALLQLYQPQWPAVQLIPYRQNLDWAFMAQQQGPLVIHSATSDLDLMWYYGRVMPARLHDTQLGYQLLHRQRPPSYKNMVKEYLAVNLDKELRESPWLQRPLSEAQQRYAAADVYYLSQLYPLLVAQLKEKGRLHWWEEEGQRLMAARRQSRFHWFNLSGSTQLMAQPAAQVIAHILTEARERVAAAQNVLRTRLLSDREIIAVAMAAPRSVVEMLDALPVGSPVVKAELDFIIDNFNCRHGLQIPFIHRPLAMNKAQHKRCREIEHYRNRIARELGIQPHIFGNYLDIQYFVLNPEDSLLGQGWRREFFSQFIN